MTATAAQPDARRLDHVALFYRGREDYLAATLAYVEAGLRADEPVLVAVPQPQIDLIRSALGSRGSEVSLVDMGVAGRNPGRIIGEVLLPFAERHSGQRVRIVGESIWDRRTANEYPACAQHEALTNIALTDRAATILCPYRMEGLPPGAIDDAERTHPYVVRDDRRSVSTSYGDPLAIAETFNLPLPLPPEPVATIVIADLNLAAVRAFTATHATAYGLSDERVDDAVLAVNELAANSLTHGGGVGTLAVWTDHDQVIFQIVDRGHLDDPMAGRRLPRIDQASGRGLLFVHRLCDLVRMHVQAAATTVRIYFDRKR